MQLRDYQETATLAAINSVAKQRNPIIALPTGTGKSLIIAALVRYFAQYEKQHVIVLTDTKELVAQNYATTKKFFRCAPGIYAAGLKRRDTKQKIIFASVQSIYKQKIKYDLAIVDECHLIPDRDTAMYRSFISENKIKNVIGLSATPFRTSGSLIENNIFDEICYDKTSGEDFLWFIKNNYLCPLVPKEAKTKLDISKVPILGGDFKENNLQQAVDCKETTKNGVQEILQHGADRKHWLIFATGENHCHNISRELTEHSISNAVITYKTENRDALIEAYKKGKIRALVNKQILSKGFDFPPIDLIVDWSPTCSAINWIQRLGRGFRPYAGKANCLVLDFGGNTKRLGPVNDVRIPNMRSLAQTKNKIVHVRAKTCPQCQALCAIATTHCMCGHMFKTAMTQKITTSASTLPVMQSHRTTASKGSDTSSTSIREDSVQHIRYIKHTSKNGKPNSLRVIYFCVKGTYNEWIFLEHPWGHYLRFQAQNWWRQRDKAYCTPTTVDKALTLVQNLRQPRAIQVQKKDKFFVIKKYIFD